MKWIRSILTGDGSGEGAAGREKGWARDLGRRTGRREAQSQKRGEERDGGERGKSSFLPKHVPKKLTHEPRALLVLQEKQALESRQPRAEALGYGWSAAPSRCTGAHPKV